MSSLMDRKLAEQTISNLVFMSIVSGYRSDPGTDLDVNHGHASCCQSSLEIGLRFHTFITFRSSLSSIDCRFRLQSCRYVLSGTIAAFATKYMHREGGFNRFFVLYALFVLGMEITSLAGTIETLFAGWELVGLSSALLVAFFHERPARPGTGYGFGSSTVFRTHRSCWRQSSYTT